MNAADLARIIAADQGLTKARARAIVALVAEALAEALAVDAVSGQDPVRLPPLGTLRAHHRRARSGMVNGQHYEAEARVTARLRPSRDLKERLERAIRTAG